MIKNSKIFNFQLCILIVNSRVYTPLNGPNLLVSGGKDKELP